ncbi:acyl-CoA dehydrogenase family protein [Actinomycetospora sp. TBRC 11914]|uniref:acyl-CoA dehydrogenase family protein n=1 Tax=Actinomycetospora sp. TBRC 11914 TaxID=2729387 RepID=UPI00145EF605|nr:acyl-CoA dehydrogenase family protein [Actinomycetospora sp. TBRC 11914]NMO92143.1 acyl-CoA/acyl-ACP dehydrogenase [Actinomycetospora sp. TBRC 11914]
MTTTATLTAPTPTDDDVLALADDVGRAAAPTEADHDRDATFVVEAYARMHENGYLRLAVPRELGGLGADIRQVLLAQERLGTWSGAAALAATMHLYLTLVQRWRLRRGAPDAERALRRVADDGLVMATSGGSDWVCPTTTAVEVEGGYRLRGRKTFCSQAPVAGVISTSAVVGEPGPGATVLHAGVPLGGSGVSIVETWDTLGMRGTASHDVVFDDVFVPAAAVTGTRPYGVLTGPLLVAAMHFALVGGAAYLGVARGACAEATRLLAARRDRAPAAVRAVGEMTARLATARWALHGALADVGEDPAADETTLAAVMTAKRHAALEARAVVDTALEVAGGAGFFRGRLERAYRDVRGGPFHPLTPEATLQLLGERAVAAGP